MNHVGVDALSNGYTLRVSVSFTVTYTTTI